MSWGGDVHAEGMRPYDLDSLVGEIVHISVMGSVLYAVYLQAGAPWWTPAIASASECVTRASSSAPSQPVRKKRRTGALKVRISDTGDM